MLRQNANGISVCGISPVARKLLYAALNAWTSPIRVGSQAIAKQFVRNGWEVAYVSAPITPLSWLRPSKREFAWRKAEHQKGGGWDLDGKLWHYVPFAWIAPNNRLPTRSRWLFDHWHSLTAPNLLAAVREQGFGEVDLLILDTIYQPFWLDKIRHRRSAVRLADYNAGFPGYGYGAKTSEEKIIRHADYVVTASAALRELAIAKGAKQAFYMPNGIDFERFEKSNFTRPQEYGSFKGPIAIFVGAIGEWVDLSLISACAKARPDVDFVLIGPGPDNSNRKPLLPNVHFLGLRPPERIPSFLCHADVGLIPFRSNRLNLLIDHINPLKLYEYLAAGLPVISTCWDELKRLESPIRTATCNDSFIAALNESLAESGNSEAYRNFARSADWSIRTAEFIQWAEQV